MKIIRYSKEAFTSQSQDCHLKRHIYPYMTGDWLQYGIMQYEKNKDLFGLQEYIDRYYKVREFVTQNRRLFDKGVWAFIDGHKCNQSLNHLKKVVPCWEAEIDDNVEVIGVNWDMKMNITDDKCKMFGFFIPEKNMESLRNVKRK